MEGGRPTIFEIMEKENGISAKYWKIFRVYVK